jgi:hypothetical protein
MKVSTGAATRADVTFSGLLLRYVDASNWFACGRLMNTVLPSTSAVLVTIVAIGGGTAYFYPPNSIPVTADTTLEAANWAKVGAVISSNGQYVVLVNGVTRMTGTHSALATGGTLATGKTGIVDICASSVWPTRSFDGFWSAAAPADAAIFASQSIELRSSGIYREDSGGTIWTPPSSYEGDFPIIPPAGKEGRSLRTIVKASRVAPGTSADSAIDDLSFRATVTPRYLVLPS